MDKENIDQRVERISENVEQALRSSGHDVEVHLRSNENKQAIAEVMNTYRSVGWQVEEINDTRRHYLRISYKVITKPF